MTSSDAPPTSRRALRARAAERERADAAAEAAAPSVPAAPAPSVPAPALALAPAPAPAPASAPAPAAPADPGRVALGWVDVDAVALRRAPGDLTAASSTFVPVLPDLLPRRRRAGRVLIPLAVVLALLGGYTAATQLWTLDNVTPVVEAADAATVTAPASAIDWPAEGMAAVGVDGVDTTSASSDDVDAMASVTKLITALMVLDERPLAAGEQGEAREIAYADRVDYWSFLGRGESALDVPVGGTLTEYQLLQGTLIASAGNYADMLVRDLWPTDESFAAAAREWLDGHALDGITVVEPTGIDRGNTSDPASLVRLGEIAMANPVVAEIVGTRTAEIEGVGEIENTNPLLSDDAVAGIKTGGLIGHYNLLAAQDVAVGDTTLRVYAAVVGQPTEELRASATADVLSQLAGEVSASQTLAAGTVVGTATTAWGTEADVVTTADTAVLLWNGASATAAADLALGDARGEGDELGTVTLAGPWNSAETTAALTGDLGEPDGWWRFTHPLELLGITG